MVLDESREQREAQSIEDITDLDNISDASQVEEKRLLKSIADLSTTSVSEIMRPRVEVAALSTSMSSSEILNKAIECGYSRLPVYEKSLDSVRGFLYVKDLVGYIKDGIEDFDWHKLIREAYFVPGSKKINDLLEEFRQKKIHLALVVDEYGGTDGIVTLEDVLEEIVGEISDESDET
jgi:CBS domain containing-hemolysin-like protein